MKATSSNIVLLASCFGIAYEVRRMLAPQQGNVELALPATPSGPVHIGRKVWLKSDRRAKMEAVATAQGWIQYVDTETRKKFWYCHFTNESFYELVFVGVSTVRLNRWCLPQGGYIGSGGIQIHQETVPRRVAPTRAAAVTDSVSRPTAVIPDAVNAEDSNTSISDADDYLVVDDGGRQNKRKPRQKPVKGRHTRGKRPIKLQLPIISHARGPQPEEAGVEDDEGARNNTAKYRLDNALSVAIRAAEAAAEDKSNYAIEVMTEDAAEVKNIHAVLIAVEAVESEAKGKGAAASTIDPPTGDLRSVLKKIGRHKARRPCVVSNTHACTASASTSAAAENRASASSFAYSKLGFEASTIEDSFACSCADWYCRERHCLGTDKSNGLLYAFA